MGTKPAPRTGGSLLVPLCCCLSQFLPALWVPFTTPPNRHGSASLFYCCILGSGFRLRCRDRHCLLDHRIFAQQ